MNMQQAIKMTAAETALVDAYTAQIGDLPGDGPCCRFATRWFTS